VSDDRELREALADKLAYWFPDAGTGQALTRDEHLAAADALLPVVEAECRRRAAEELRLVANALEGFTPLSQRESGFLTDYTQGLHAAGELVRFRAGEIDPEP